ncbi:MAG TPA: hypothetical protein VF590_17750, partial [Isosphaeraceae bacterium]
MTRPCLKLACQEPADLGDLAWFGLDSMVFSRGGRPLFVRKPGGGPFDAVTATEALLGCESGFNRYVLGGTAVFANGAVEEGLNQVLERSGDAFVGRVLYDVFDPRSIWAFRLSGPQIRPDDPSTRKAFALFRSSDVFVQEQVGGTWRYLLHVVDFAQFMEANWFHLIGFAEEDNPWTRRFRLSRHPRLPLRGGKIEGLDEFLERIPPRRPIDVDAFRDLLAPDTLLTIAAAYERERGRPHESEVNLELFSSNPL